MVLGLARELYTATWLISGIFALLACILSLHLIYKHLQYYTDPKLQKYIVRILWMIPIYALDSFFSLKYYESALYFDVWRDCYEAYVLYCFFSLLISYLDGIEVLEDILETKPPMSHPFPMCFLPKFKPGRNFLLWCRRFILQFVLVKPILSAISLLLEIFDLYDDGIIQFNRGYIYIAIVYNISISFSLYYLVLFYIATEENLKPYKPLPKFICIKSIIFFSFWQGMAIVALVKLRLIVDTNDFTAGNIALFVQNFLICIEMCFLAIIHRYVFGYEQFLPNNNSSNNNSSNNNNNNESDIELDIISEINENPIPNTKKSFVVLKNFKDVANVSDVIGEARDVFKPPNHNYKHAKDK